ncbi:nuclear transport factor 2 family protein [Streptomyces sp. NPDC093094]|uniref:nuclear transport factor 2 family protein n=1 Tax=Streptomyces sp. NPDC093094 TaxID=3366026 RepID=UPI003826DB46
MTIHATGTAAATALDTTPVAGLEALLYARVQQFYAHQTALLDELRAQEFAATFTEDGVLTPAPIASAARGRAAIAAALVAAHERRFGTEQVRRRHWQDALRVQELPDGSLRASYCTLVTVVRPWHPVPALGPSAAVEDVLVLDGGELRVRERRITPDHLAF